MDKKVEEFSRVKEIGFMGKVTASLSHEIKNTLAIINESVGLMGDLLGRDAPDDWPQYSRLATLLTTIEEQIQRSADIVKRLNQFAHSMDKSLVDIDLNEFVQEITTLAQRFARLRGVQLEVEAAPEPLVIHSNPFRVQYVIFGFIERALWRCSANQTKVTLTCSSLDDMAQVMVTDQGSPEGDWLRKQLAAASSPTDIPGGEEDPELTILALTMAELGGSVEIEEVGKTGNKVILSFPPNIPEM
jgi:C4-dicarboxylate-specific signal transduction histidine kinase